MLDTGPACAGGVLKGGTHDFVPLTTYIGKIHTVSKRKVKHLDKIICKVHGRASTLQNCPVFAFSAFKKINMRKGDLILLFLSSVINPC